MWRTLEIWAGCAISKGYVFPKASDNNNNQTFICHQYVKIISDALMISHRMEA